jgi:hypothetical protein
MNIYDRELEMKSLCWIFTLLMLLYIEYLLYKYCELIIYGKNNDII